MNNFDASAYSMLVQKQEIEGHYFYVGKVQEFPDVEVYEESVTDAYEALEDVVTTLKMVSDRDGGAFPTPLPRMESNDDFSGRVTLRLPKSLHYKVAMMAESDGVSLNTLLMSFIAEGIGERKAVSQIKPVTIQYTNHNNILNYTAGNSVVIATAPNKTETSIFPNADKPLKVVAGYTH